MRFESRQALRLRGEVELSIGVTEGEEPYLFAKVEALTRGFDERIYVGDTGAQEVRAFDSTGAYLFQVGRPGEGPGEFRGFQICGLAFDPEGRLWVNSRDAYKVFSIVGNTASYEKGVRIPERNSTLCGNPMFVGSTGLTLASTRMISVDEAIHEHLQITADGDVLRRIPIDLETNWGEWEWPSISRPGGRRDLRIEPPFAARRIVAHSPGGDAAYVFTPEYDIHLFSPNGELKTRIQRVLAGPRVTETEARAEHERLNEYRELADSIGGKFPEYRMPDRKPVIVRMWYDDDGRLWVMPWPAEGDALWQAHVYDSDGVQLHTAEWPAGIALSLGGTRGNVALGVERMAFDVERVVRLRFAPVDEGNGEA